MAKWQRESSARMTVRKGMRRKRKEIQAGRWGDREMKAWQPEGSRSKRKGRKMGKESRRGKEAGESF